MSVVNPRQNKQPRELRTLPFKPSKQIKLTLKHLASEADESALSVTPSIVQAQVDVDIVQLSTKTFQHIMLDQDPAPNKLRLYSDNFYLIPDSLRFKLDHLQSASARLRLKSLIIRI